MNRNYLVFACLFILYSCSKDQNKLSNLPGYVGSYISTSKDTVKVSTNGAYAKFVYNSFETVHTPVPPPTTPTNIGLKEAQIEKIFDSVQVASDLKFTDNEICITNVRYTGSIYPLPAPYSLKDASVGTGSFGTNSISINFGALVFDGIKLQ